MQVKIKQEPKVFNPVTLEITFETEDELNLTKKMLEWDVSIPDIAFPNDESAQQRLVSIMGKIRVSINIAMQGDLFARRALRALREAPLAEGHLAELAL